MARLAVVVLFAFANSMVLCQAVLNAQNAQKPTFTTGTTLVEVGVIVQDGKGGFVADLKKEDFEIFEDGERQEISVFTMVDLSTPNFQGTPPLVKALPKDAATNRFSRQSRIYFLILDSLHTQPDQSTQVRMRARMFVEKYVQPEDLVALAFTGGGKAYWFTHDHQKILAAIDQFIGRKVNVAEAKELESSMQDMAAAVATSRGPRGGAMGRGRPGEETQMPKAQNPEEIKQAHDAIDAMGTIQAVAESMSPTKGRRKSIVFVTAGLDVNVFNVMGEGSAYTSQVQEAIGAAIGAATRADVPIYTIDPRGLVAEAHMSARSAPKPGGVSGLSLEVSFSRQVAGETGGVAGVNSNDFDRMFRRVVEENSRYYILSYASNNPKTDGSKHKIKVKVIGRTGLTVKAREGYTSPDVKKEQRARAKQLEELAKRSKNQPAASGTRLSPELELVMSSPLPVSNLSMSISAVPFRGESGKALVLTTVQVEGETFPARIEGDKLIADLQFALLVSDSNGDFVTGSKGELPLRLEANEVTVARARIGGVRWVSELMLKPGRYTLRAGVSGAAASDAKGSVSFDLEVPDFEKDLAISGVILTSPVALVAFTHGWQEGNRWNLPVPITATRQFTDADTLYLAADIYTSDSGNGCSVQVTAEKIEADVDVEKEKRKGRQTHLFFLDLKPSEFQKDRYKARLVIPGNSLSIGRYLLRFQARLAEGSNKSVVRELEFQIVPKLEIQSSDNVEK